MQELGIPDLAADESRLVRRTFLVLLGVWLVVFSLFAHRFWAAANGAADQNAYLVGAKLFVEHGSPRLVPRDPVTGAYDPHQYVGLMWTGVNLRTEDACYYPKYPCGTWMVQGLALKLAGPTGVYLLSPASMVVALTFIYLLIRLFAGSLAAVLAVIVLPLNGTMLALTNSPCSHVLGLSFISAGMFFLVRWMQIGCGWRALAAGVLLGAAATTRYLDGLFILPMLVAAGFILTRSAAADASAGAHMRKRHAVFLLGGWVLPLGGLVVLNLLTVGGLTGYDATGESRSFSLTYLQEHWAHYLWLLQNVGLPYFFALAVAGLLAMFAWNWRAATLLASWAAPSLIASMAYYFEPNTRFLVPLLPVFMLCAVWLVAWPMRMIETRMIPHADGARTRWRTPLATTLAILGVFALPLSTELPREWGEVRKDQQEWLNVAAQADAIMAVAPPGSLIFASQPKSLNNLFNHLQFVGDYYLYCDEAFRFDLQRSVEPAPWISADRMAATRERMRSMSAAELQTARESLILSAAQKGIASFIFTTEPEASIVLRAWGSSRLELKPRGAHLDPYPTTGRLLRPAGWERVQGQRVRWYLYELQATLDHGSRGAVDRDVNAGNG